MSNLSWIDLETTGLDPQLDVILEIGIIVTDDELNEVARKSLNIKPAQPRQLSQFVHDMHTRNGLLKEIDDGFAVDSDTAQFEMARFVVDNNAGSTPLCGSTVGFDRGFLKVHMSTLEAMFHYRSIDISTVLEMAKRWSPDTVEAGPDGRGIHRSIPDLEDTLAAARWYKSQLFVPAGAYA